MILDNETELATTVALDLGTVRPGPGNPIKMFAAGVGAALTITSGAAVTANDFVAITVDATNDVEFELPSNTARYIMATFAAGTVNVIMPGAQTAV